MVKGSQIALNKGNRQANNEQSDSSRIDFSISSYRRSGISGTVIDVRIILQYALKANASGIILCHKHPSGNLEPSEADIKITSKLEEAAGIHDITLLEIGRAHV